MDLDFNFHLSFIDFFIVVVLFWAIYKGYMRGAIIHSVSLLVLLACIGLSSKLSYLIYDIVQTRSNVKLFYMPVFIFGFLLIPSFYLSYFVSVKVIGNIGKSPQGLINRMLGVAVCVVKYLYIMSTLFIFLYKLDFSYQFIHKNEKDRSALFYPVLSIAPATFKSLVFSEIYPVPKNRKEYKEHLKKESQKNSGNY